MLKEIEALKKDRKKSDDKRRKTEKRMRNHIEMLETQLEFSRLKSDIVSKEAIETATTVKAEMAVQMKELIALQEALGLRNSLGKEKAVKMLGSVLSSWMAGTLRGCLFNFRTNHKACVAVAEPRAQTSAAAGRGIRELSSR